MLKLAFDHRDTAIYDAKVDESRPVFCGLVGPFTQGVITPLYKKFSVAETGTLSAKDAKAKAEIQVISDARVPVAKIALKKRFETDYSK
ncbi:hypothetical protein HU735_03580 [Pseudomonas sp. BW16M2]|uniref:hypothetical protein n=1 Tax=Pseudomonas sp. BW16M2 TaxID=2745489 RepID=UPI0016469A6A|nr:hypothetical protein [Pseudomonas sp. BW16M2]MBC3434484.1 hypothetical protein [Pseudomonas sp. BW16M2]